MSVVKTAAQIPSKAQDSFICHFTACGFCPQLSLGCKMAAIPPSIASEFRGEKGAVSPIKKAKTFPKPLADLVVRTGPRGYHSCTHFGSQRVEEDTYRVTRPKQNLPQVTTAPSSVLP